MDEILVPISEDHHLLWRRDSLMSFYHLQIVLDPFAVVEASMEVALEDQKVSIDQSWQAC